MIFFSAFSTVFINSWAPIIDQLLIIIFLKQRYNIYFITPQYIVVTLFALIGKYRDVIFSPKMGCQKPHFQTDGKQRMDCTPLDLQEEGSQERPLTPLILLAILANNGGQSKTVTITIVVLILFFSRKHNLQKKEKKSIRWEFTRVIFSSFSFTPTFRIL